MATFRDLLRAAKADITEVDVDAGARLLDEGHVLLDVREHDEYEQGAIPGSMHIPGHTRNVGRTADTGSEPAAGGDVRRGPAPPSPCRRCTNSAIRTPCRWMAASTGGRTQVSRARPYPRLCRAQPYQRHLLLPGVGEEGQRP